MPNTDREDRIKAHAATILAECICPKTMRTKAVADKINDDFPELGTPNSINRVLTQLPAPFQIEGVPAMICLKNVMAAALVVSDVYQNQAENLTKDHEKNIKEAVKAAAMAVEKVQAALEVVTKLHEMAKDYAADAELAAKTAKHAARG